MSAGAVGSASLLSSSQSVMNTQGGVLRQGRVEVRSFHLPVLAVSSASGDARGFGEHHPTGRSRLSHVSRRQNVHDSLGLMEPADPVIFPRAGHAGQKTCKHRTLTGAAPSRPPR